MKNLILLFIIFFSGCSLFDEEKDAQVEFRLENNSMYEGELPIRIDFSSPSQSENLTASDFSGTKFFVGPYKTATSGTLKIVVQLLYTNDKVEVSETVKLPLKSDWKYGITVAVGPTNPINLCFGCQASKAVAINSKLNFPETDSLFIVWGGNSISNPVDF